MNNKLISFSLLLSMLCTTNIVFGMKKITPFSEGFIIKNTRKINNQNYSVRTITQTGGLSSIVGSFSSKPQMADTATLTMLSKDLTSTNCQISYSKKSYPIEIPNAQITSMINILKENKSLNDIDILSIIGTNDQTIEIKIEKINDYTSFSWFTLIGVPVIFLASIVTAYFYFFRK